MSLNLAGSSVDDEGIVVLEGLHRLLEIDLSNTGITDNAIAALSNLRGLDAIDLSGTHVTDAGILRLRLPASESVLRIAGLQLRDDTIRALKLKYPKCRVDRQPKKSLGALSTIVAKSSRQPRTVCLVKSQKLNNA